jgi:hypothetical protein
VDDGVNPAQGMPKGERVGQVTQRDLNPDPLGSEPPRVPDQAAHGDPRGGQAPDQREPNSSGGAGQ